MLKSKAFVKAHIILKCLLRILYLFWYIKQLYIIVDMSFYYFTSIYIFLITPCEHNIFFKLRLHFLQTF